MTNFTGSITALITPFTAQGRVDEDAFARLVDWQIEQGTTGLVPCGTTGESPTLTHKEHCHIVELTVKQAKGRVPVMAGAGSNATSEAVEFTRHAEKVGAQGVLVVTPYYNKPSQEGMFQHFKAVAAATSLPIFIYNIPGRSIVDLTNETMARLAEIKNIVGVKDATSDLSRVPAYQQLCGKDFCQLSGEDGTTLAYMKAGGVGAISVTANIAPALCAQFQVACLEGDWQKAEALDKRLQPLHQGLFVAPNPAPAKYVANRLGICLPHLRLPLIELNAQEKTHLDKIIKPLGLEQNGDSRRK